MSAVMGALVIAISTEFSVLLSSRYREERAGGRGAGGGDRARRTPRPGAAVLASGVTAIMGFAALIASDIRMLRDFGVVTVVDLTVSLLGVMVVLPAALVWAERRRFGCATSTRAAGGARCARSSPACAARVPRPSLPRPRLPRRSPCLTASPEDRPPEDRFGDLGPREPSAAERFAELDEGDMEAERQERERAGAGAAAPGRPLHVGRRRRRARSWSSSSPSTRSRTPAAATAARRRASASRCSRRRSRRATPRVTRTSSRTRRRRRGQRDARLRRRAARGRQRRASCSRRSRSCSRSTVPAGDCERQLEAMQTLSQARPDLQFAAVDQRAPRTTSHGRSWSARASTLPGRRWTATWPSSTSTASRTAARRSPTAAGELREFRANKPLSAEELEKMLP